MLKEKGRKMTTVEVPGVTVGRDKTVVFPEDVEKLAAIGCKDSEIADWFGIDGNTLRYNFSAELIKGREGLKQSLRRAQIKFALEGSNALLIWLGKNVLNQQETPEVEIDESEREIKISVKRPKKPEVKSES